MRRLVLAGFLVTCVPASPSLACTCIGPQHEWTIRGSTLVFAAEILSLDKHPSSEFLARYPLRVIAVWKGDLPESTYVDASWSGSCGYDFEVGRQYLIYMAADEAERRQVHLCSGTAPLDVLYYDRFLLGEPVTRYDAEYETVTLETMLDLVTKAGSEDDLAWQFSYFKIEASLLLPRLLRVANGHVPGNQIAALRAIGALGTSAEPAYATLGGAILTLDPRNAEINAEKILAMASVCGDFERMTVILERALTDESPLLRRAAVRSCRALDDPSDALEISRLLRLALNDEDAEVRATAIRGLRYRHDPAAARRIKTMSRSDPDDTVRSTARDYLKWQYRWSKAARPHGTLRDRGITYRRQ